MAEGINIKVIGVGGAGCNSVNNMFKEGLVWDDVDYIKLDEAELYQQQAKEIAAGTDIAVVVAGLGGHMGSRTTPLVIKDLKGSGAFVIAVTFMPFDF